MCEIQQPFAPVAAAAALWGRPVGLGPEARAAVEAASALQGPGAPGLLIQPGGGGLPCLGGVNRDADADSSVWLDPRRTKLAAPPMPDLPRPYPPTQFAVVGPVILEALLLDVMPAGACVCGGCGGAGGAAACAWIGGALAPYSIGALLLTRRNGVRVRRALQDAGLVAASAPLRAIPADSLPCLCAALGGDRDLVDALVTFATSYGDTAAITQPRPADTVLYLNGVFVNNTLTRAREAVNSAARANYARAEGNRAYVTPRPAPPQSLTECPQVAVDQTSEGLLERALTDPASNPVRRAELACLTGIPLNQTGSTVVVSMSTVPPNTTCAAPC